MSPVRIAILRELHIADATAAQLAPRVGVGRLRIYSTMHSMERAGYISHRWGHLRPEQGPGPCIYLITQKGRQALDEEKT